MKAELEANRPTARPRPSTPEDEKRIRGFQFLSQKPMLCVLNLGEEDAPRLHEVEEKYRNGPFAGPSRHRSHRDLRQDRSRTRRTVR